ncbi:MAG: hypothetical protein HZB31_01685 [Nitrospirae bacterium]|nr:hypothetical protein [Nitrospirota bacterium]
MKTSEFVSVQRNIHWHHLIADGSPSSNYLAELLADYERNIHLFFDSKTGAICEAGRDDGTPAFLYSELTGLAIPDMLDLFALTGNRSYLSASERAATWLIQHSFCQGWFRTRYYFEVDKDPSLSLYSFFGGKFFSFDNAVCLMGITALYEINQSEELYNVGAQVAEGLVNLVREDGSVPAVFMSDGQEIKLANPRWSQQSGCVHAKIAEALAEWMRVTENYCYELICRRICTFALEFQQMDGRFITDRIAGTTQLHPHCYAAEGLLRTGQILREPKYEEAALKATLWALQHSNNGRISQEFINNTPRLTACRNDALAQILILAARLTSMGRLPIDAWATVTEVAEALLISKDSEQGFFKYGEYEDGTVSTTLSYWTNAFAFRALRQYAAAWLARNSIVVILAGGAGRRAWPIAGSNRPKAIVRGFLREGSLLESTVNRFIDSGCAQPESIIVVTSQTGLKIANKQLISFGVKSESTLAEPAPEGPVAALKCADQQIEQSKRSFLIVSMADDLIEPVSTFGDALVRGALTALHYPSTIITLGVKTAGWNEHFGHSFYGDSLSPGVHKIEEFIEKPAKDEFCSRKDLPHAWESGCVISRTETITNILIRGTTKQKDIARSILEPAELSRAVSLYSSAVSFADFGALGDYILDFFKDTFFDQSGNRCFSDAPGRIVLESAERNVVLSDRLPVNVVGVSDHLIIDSSECNTALVLPLSEHSRWTDLFKKLSRSCELQPYLQGGISATSALPLCLNLESMGECRVQSLMGFVVTFRCANVSVERNASGLTVAQFC